MHWWYPYGTCVECIFYSEKKCARYPVRIEVTDAYFCGEWRCGGGHVSPDWMRKANDERKRRLALEKTVKLLRAKQKTQKREGVNAHTL